MTSLSRSGRKGHCLSVFALLGIACASKGPFGLSTHAFRAVERDVEQAANVGLQNVFQVAEPVLTPATTGDEATCTQVVMEHSFGNSYGAPFVGKYQPPGCDFNRVTLNFTVVSRGRQFDRLGYVYLNDTEIWRTSTAEPSRRGIRWEYTKDVSEFFSLWKEPQTIIFDLGNLINEIYTAPFNTTLTLTFFKSAVQTGDQPPADLVIPVTKRLGSTKAVSSVWTLPDEEAVSTVSFPRNARRAVFSVAATGQANEEFWWSNLPNSTADAFNQTAGISPGYSPFREVQLHIDGRLAGVHWPFPIIFTGGILPALHRPIVGLDAFDLREHEIDITPWLPLLCDGKDHTFSIAVFGLLDNGKNEAHLANDTIYQWWIVSGKVFVWLDSDPNTVTTGSDPVVSADELSITFSQTLTKNSTGFNESLSFDLAVQRTFSVKGEVKTLNTTGTVSWVQELLYSSATAITDFGNAQTNKFNSSGQEKTRGAIEYSNAYAYPLRVNTTVTTDSCGNVTFRALLHQGLDLATTGASVHTSGVEAFEAGNNAVQFAGGALSTFRDGYANMTQDVDKNVTSVWGQVKQDFRFGGLADGAALDSKGGLLLYSRLVEVTNGTVTSDTNKALPS